MYGQGRGMDMVESDGYLEGASAIRRMSIVSPPKGLNRLWHSQRYFTHSGQIKI